MPGGIYYNSNGLAFHRIEDAARLLADLGYDGLALTPDVHHLDPLRTTSAENESFRRLCEKLGLGIVIETGARFVLDARRKHRPSLLDEPDDAARRVDFLRRCVDQAVLLGAPVVTVWSGNGPDGTPDDVLRARLIDGLRRLCDHAASSGVRIGFEPEPGMWLETVPQYVALRDALAHETLGLTLDVGHCLATNEGPPEAAIRAEAQDLLVLQLDDHRPGVHDHLMFGEGCVDFAAIAAAVAETGFAGPLEVELSRHASSAPTTAASSLAFLQAHFGR
ncbi:MAG: sugar phosphate isomerase/epimerase [Planctomycetota bacterium]|nr:sugar phosphate isomerase/epimerase [Planctomycetota bacterium]